MARSPADWAGPAAAAVGSDIVMSGQVVEALPQTDGSVVVSLGSALMLSEP